MRRETAATGLLWAALSTCAWAQDAPPQSPAVRLGDVEITGSLLKGNELESISPVQVIDRADLRRSGANSLKELLEATVIFPGIGSDTGGRGTFAAGSTSIALRNLGSQSTLVLLNGRRVAPYPLAEYSAIFTNIDSLPLEAIERVEVLRSGASAVYGSEAVAGVINVITRPDYEGVYGRVSRQQSVINGSFGTRTASLTGGKGRLATDGYNLMANVEVFHRDEVLWREVLGYVNPILLAQFPSVGSLSTYSYPGNLFPGGALPGCAPELLITACAVTTATSASS